MSIRIHQYTHKHRSFNIESYARAEACRINKGDVYRELLLPPLAESLRGLLQV